MTLLAEKFQQGWVREQSEQGTQGPCRSVAHSYHLGDECGGLGGHCSPTWWARALGTGCGHWLRIVTHREQTGLAILGPPASSRLAPRPGERAGGEAGAPSPEDQSRADVTSGSGSPRGGSPRKRKGNQGASRGTQWPKTE